MRIHYHRSTELVLGATLLLVTVLLVATAGSIWGGVQSHVGSSGSSSNGGTNSDKDAVVPEALKSLQAEINRQQQPQPEQSIEKERDLFSLKDFLGGFGFGGGGDGGDQEGGGDGGGVDQEEEEEENSDDVKQKKQGFGERCGNHNLCREGLDCVLPTSGRDKDRWTTAGWKICLPVSCVLQAAENFNNNTKPDARDTTPFEDYVGSILRGAGLSQSLMMYGGEDDSSREEAMMAEVINRTTAARGEDVMKNNNYLHYLKDDVRDALKSSLLQENARNPMAALDEKVLECFRPFLDTTTSTGTGMIPSSLSHHNNQHYRNGTHNIRGRSRQRNLQDIPDLTGFPLFDFVIMHGFFVDFAAAVQILYGWGTSSTTIDDGNGTSATFDFILGDVCFGLGPAAGAGVGYLLSLLFPIEIPVSGGNFWENYLTDQLSQQLLQKKQQGLENPEQTVNEQVIIPFPLLLFDLDAAAGPGVGVAYNTLCFLWHRLWLKFYLGAGGGYTCSMCLTTLEINGAVN